ncbi:hypothetical protein GOBAR_DD33467 [Gossypium barbadense]|nr:hypothetical protein GOBAR_DD33467 [Gossypium barbadense]
MVSTISAEIFSCFPNRYNTTSPKRWLLFPLMSSTELLFTTCYWTTVWASPVTILVELSFNVEAFAFLFQIMMEVLLKALQAIHVHWENIRNYNIKWETTMVTLRLNHRSPS